MLFPTFALAQIVSISAPAATADQLDAAVEGCNQVLEGKCESGEEGLWQARVTWSDAGDSRAIILIERRTEEGETIESFSRDVEFSLDDPLEQSYRAVGLIIAAYVVAKGSEPPPPPAVPAAKHEERSIAAVETAPDPSEHEPEKSIWGWDTHFVIGGGWTSSAAPLGASLRPFFHIRRIPLRMSVELRWLRTVGLAETDWLSLAPGISLSLTPPHWPLRNELRLQAGVMSVLIEAIRGDQQESARAWRLGARAGLDLVIPFSSHLALLLAGDVGFWSPQLRLDVAGEPVGVSDLPELQGLLGIRFEQ